MKAEALIAFMAFTCSGCFTASLYEGEKRGRDEVARISGDPRVTAGTPVTVILRQVDGHSLSIGQSSVDVLPGTHTLLVDCRIAETSSTTRHTIEAEVSAGSSYRLVADTGPGLRECTDVRLEASR
jgi:hypothetical protein